MIYAIEPQINNNSIKDLWNEELEPHINGGQCIKNNDKFPFDFYCYHFALNDRHLFSCEHGIEVLELNYKRIGIKKAKRGDIITYHDDIECRGKKQIDQYSIQHFAIIVKTNGTIGGTVVKSKWGEDGVFKGTINNIPESYGEIVAVWTKIKEWRI